jgi:hypothetical protein
MAKSLESPTKLTEFAPLAPPESQQSTGIRSTFARWFGINNKNPPPTIKEVVTGASEVPCPPSRSSSRDDISQSGESTVSNITYTGEGGLPVQYCEGRTLVSVLTR